MIFPSLSDLIHHHHQLLLTAKNGFPIGSKILEMLESDLLKWFAVRCFFRRRAGGRGRKRCIKVREVRSTKGSTNNGWVSRTATGGHQL
jgi:hypothetical protein